jgi:nitrite reductase/ring-hydroxylating ferredoxin subunit
LATRKFIVGRVADLDDGERMIVNVNGRSIGIFNVHGKYYGLPNRCPHKGAEMCRGVLVGELSSPEPGVFSYDADRKFVTCPWHGWEFDVATGQSYFDPARTRIRTYAVEVEDGTAALTDLDGGSVNESPTPDQYIRMRQAGYKIDEEGHGVTDPEGGRMPGPYSVETIKIDVDGDYLVVDLTPPRPERPARPARERN